MSSTSTAIRLASLPLSHIQDVAKTSFIHPFVLSRYKKEYREGKIAGTCPDIGKFCELGEKMTAQSRIRELEWGLKKAQIEDGSYM
jgi:transposase